jgi:hypothetical protein
LLWSAVAVYGPADAVLAWVLAAVPCSHCKEAAVMILPAGPGFVLLHLVMQWTGSAFLRGLPDAAMVVLGGVVSAAVAVGLAWIGRRGWWWLILGCLIAASVSLVTALSTVAAIRS